MHDVLRVTKLGHRFGSASVLSDVSFSIRPRELVAVLGVSGCGKTTLLRCIAGLLTPTRGDVTVGTTQVVRAGKNLVPVEQRQVGLLFQDYALFGALNLRENIAYGARKEPERVASLLESIGLTELAGRYPSSLSGGQQQRVALARALAPRPSLLLLDEPFANVDADRREHLANSLRSTLEQEQQAVMMVTHERNDALGMADRVLVLVNDGDGGQVAQFDTPAVVYARPNSREVARLTGLVSFVPCRVREGVGEHPWGRCRVDSSSGEGGLCLRPEQVTLSQGSGGTVSRSSFAGRHYLTRVRTPHGEVWAEHPERLVVGSPVSLSVGGQPAFVTDSE